MSFNLDDAIRKVPDFPKKGIMFYDITSVLADPVAFKWTNDKMLDIYKDVHFDAVVAIESRGFIFASPFALARKLPLILVRKAGKLPGKTVKRSYSLEYGTAEVEVHVDDVPKGGKLLLVDDLLATGGTVRATAEVIAEAGGEATHVFSAIGLPFLNYKDKLKDLTITTLQDYYSE